MVSAQRKNKLLSWLNSLLTKYGGQPIGRVGDYQNQWLISASLTEGYTILHLRFCQGRSVGKICNRGGFSWKIAIGSAKTKEEFFQLFYNINPKTENIWLETQPWYIKKKRLRKEKNKKIGMAKGCLTKAYRSGKKLNKKHIKILNKYGEFEKWAKLADKNTAERFFALVRSKR